MRHILAFSRITLSVLALAVLRAPLQAQSGVASARDARWQPWLGCWKPVGSILPVVGVSTETTPVAATTMICVVPGNTNTSVEVVNFSSGKVTERTVIEPGQSVAKKVDECSGAETATWSADGHRLMLRGNFACPRGIARTESGIMSIDADGQWVQAQSVKVNGNTNTFLAHFVDTGIALEAIADGAIVERPMLDSLGRRLSPPREGCTGTEAVTPSSDGRRVSVRSDYTCAGSGLHRVANAEFERAPNGEWTRTDRVTVPFGTGWARAAAGAPVTTKDVLEVSKAVDVNVAEAWLTDRGQGFDLNGKQLVQLADAGMPSRVIDVIVAISHPETFQLRRADDASTRIAANENGRDRNQTRSMDRMCASDPGYCRSSIGLSWMYGADRYYGWSPYGYGYGLSRYGYGYGYGYGYPYGNYWGPGYYTGNGPVVVIKPSTPEPRGRAVYGQGYTRGGSSPQPSSSGSVYSGSSGSGSSGGSSGSSGGGSSSGGSSGGGASGGGGEARTAKPRGGGL